MASLLVDKNQPLSGSELHKSKAVKTLERAVV